MNNSSKIYTISKRVGSLSSNVIIYKYNFGSSSFSFDGNVSLSSNNTNNKNTDGFMIVEIDDYINIIYEKDQTDINDLYKNNAISYDTINYYSGSIINGICNNNSRIEGYVYDVIDTKKSVIFRSKHEISMFEWDGSDLQLRNRFEPANHISSIGSLVDASFTDLFLKDSNTILTTVKTTEYDYKLIKIKIVNNEFNITDTVNGVNDKIYSFQSDMSNVKIIENNYYDVTSQTTNKYIFLNTVNSGSNNLIAIDSDSSNWDNMNILTLPNLYDFNINIITSGTNNTNTLDYTLLYSTDESSAQENKKFSK